MNVKTLAQIFLIFTIVLITLFFFYKYFYKTNNQTQLEQNEVIIEENSLKEKADNIIEDLSFENIDMDGNKFKINSKFGEISIDEENSVKLTNVKAEIKIVGKDTIFITSERADYNKVNLKTKFYINVNIFYQENLVTSDNFYIDLSRNFASINGNIIFNNKNMESYADNIDFNILDESITINMFDKEDTIKINRK